MMKRLVVIAALVLAALAGIAFYAGFFSRPPAQAASANAAQGGGGAGGGAFGRPPMTVELASPSRSDMAQTLTVVGNLVAEQTVAVVPKTAGRLDQVYVKLGDRVARGQRMAKIEDREILEQVKQAEAAFEVARATIRQREADLRFAETNLNRSRELFGRELLPKQTLDDADARHQAAVAQLELSRAQLTQSQSRLDELRINLANTIIASPVNGLIARRHVDSGAYVSPSAPVAEVVDISTVRLIAAVVEKDLRRIETGEPAKVEVDAFPGEAFGGRIARVAPVLDPATRTAQIEVEIPNPGTRLKPGMYARVTVTIEQRSKALTIPTNAVVNVDGRRGVFLAKANTAEFRAIEIGIEDSARVEVLKGLTEGEAVVTTGSAGLQDGDRIVLAGQGSDGAAPRPARRRAQNAQPTR